MTTHAPATPAEPDDAAPGREANTLPHLENERTLFEGPPPVLGSIGRWTLAVLTLGLAALWFWAANIGQHRRITDQRIIRKYGVFNRRTETLELYRVTDLSVEEPLGERLVGYGRLVLLSSDRNEGKLVLAGLRGVDGLADQVRHAIERQKMARRVATLAEA